MQLPVAFRPSSTFMPPMYTWPHLIKRIFLTVLVLAVIGAYLLFASGIVAFLALLVGLVGG